MFEKIKIAEHTFASWLEIEYAKLYKATPAITHVADVIIKYAVPAISLIVSAEVGPGAGAEVQAVGIEAQKDLLVASSLIYDFGPNPKAADLIAGVSSNLTGLISAGHVTNAQSVANVTKVANTVAALAQALTPPVVAAATA